MNTPIKLAVLGACALAVSSTAALAESELPRGITTGLSIGMPLPEGVYDISIASYGSQDPKAIPLANNSAYAVPVWLVWWTPWQIAGGRIMFDTATAIGDSWASGSGETGIDSWMNTLVEGGIGWNLGGGWGVSLHAGAWLPSTQTLPSILGRNYTAFQGGAAISYVASGWNISATGIYGSGGNEQDVHGQQLTAQQAEWVNIDLTAAKHFGKYETGVVAYGSWDLTNSGSLSCYLATGDHTPCKQSQFAVGSLVGYDFGTFVAQAKLTVDVEESNYGGRETRGTVTIIKPLWVAPSDAPLK
jgi:hypothetical protein